MNALNVTVFHPTQGCFGRSDSKMCQQLFLRSWKAFVAGADVKFVDKIRAMSEISTTSQPTDILFWTARESPKTTIALTTGLALGGGLELALSCDYRVGTRRTQFRFPETSIGIYPGLGGTQRTPRICGIECARFAVLAGNFLDAESAKALGLLTHLVDPSAVETTVSAIAAQGKPGEKYPSKPADSEHSVVSFATSFTLMTTCFSAFGKSSRGYDSKTRWFPDNWSLSRTAPIALSMASDLLDTATRSDLNSPREEPKGSILYSVLMTL